MKSCEKNSYKVPCMGVVFPFSNSSARMRLLEEIFKFLHSGGNF